MVVVDALHGDTAAAVADDLFGGDLQAFLDHAAPDVKPSGGGGADEGEEELEWLSNKDAFPTVETMAPSAPRRRTKKGLPRPRWEVAWGPPQAPVAARAPAAGWRCRHCGTDRTPQWREGPEGRSTLCNACGVRYRSGRLVPEYRPLSSPTFSPELHSNWHRRVVELRRLREGAANASLAAAGNGEKGNEKLERLLNKGEFLAVQMMAAAPARPRTEGMRRPRKAGWTGIAWSPPPPPRAPAVEGRLPSQGGGAGVAVEQGRVPDGDDDGLGGCAAVPADGGLNPAAPLAPSAAAGWRCHQCGTEKTPQWHPEGRTTLCFDGHNRGKLHRHQELSAKSPPATAGGHEEGKEQLEWPSNMDAFPAVKATPPAGPAPRPQTKRVRRVVELSPPRAPPPPRRQALAVEQEVVGDVGAAAVEGRATAAEGGGGDPAAATPRAPAVSGRQCRHCGAEKTPQWREGPEGRQTLCNACGVYKSGRLVPEYRPASSPTFSPGLHSNSHRQVLQLRSRRKEPAEVSPASAVVAMACAAAAAAAVVGFCFD